MGVGLIKADAAFQSVITRAVLKPERFRGGCAFGADGEAAGLFREVSSTDAVELARPSGLCQRSGPYGAGRSGRLTGLALS